MKVLVTGGAGYIGSHTIVELLAHGHEPIIADNFSNSSPEVLKRLKRITGHDVPHHKIDLTDLAATTKLVNELKPDAVIHFAALKSVGESVQQPLHYYRNNLGCLLNVTQAMGTAKLSTKRLVFSSSATVYGNPSRVPISEDMSLSTTNPYGATKLMGEMILRDVAVADPSWRLTLLRYFNPVGADPSGLIGESPAGIPNNIMPYITQVAVGKLPQLQIFGDDYDTPDGTGVRDYLHVVDLAQAHVKAIEAASNEPVVTYNLGTGQGYSVLELIHAFEKASGKTIPYEVVARRPGDIATCYADPTKANRELGWTAQKRLDEMCRDAWRWQSQNPQGY
jgi:UDP-glucose 4-epimerase